MREPSLLITGFLGWLWMRQAMTDDLEGKLELVAAGDRTAFRAVYDIAGPRLLSICKRFMRDPEAANDALQDVMFRIWEKSPLFDRNKGDAMAWMATLARNVLINRLPDKQAAALSLESEEIASIVNALTISRDPSLGPDLRRCLTELKEDYRQCVILAYHYGLSYEELAALRAVPVGTIKTWIHRAVGQLQTCLSQ
jgi:RNA polymerase sigma-70 factor (ECF subfamily)